VSATDKRRSARSRPRLERGRPRLTGRAAVLLVAMIGLALMAVVPVSRLLDQGAAIADLEERAAALDEQNAHLRGEIGRLHDPVHLEELARECLGMVAAGEVAFLTPGRPRNASGC
jgi:cell division protein FtsB